MPTKCTLSRRAHVCANAGRGRRRNSPKHRCTRARRPRKSARGGYSRSQNAPRCRSIAAPAALPARPCRQGSRTRRQKMRSVCACLKVSYIYFSAGRTLCQGCAPRIVGLKRMPPAPLWRRGRTTYRIIAPRTRSRLPPRRQEGRHSCRSRAAGQPARRGRQAPKVQRECRARCLPPTRLR